MGKLPSKTNNRIYGKTVYVQSNVLPKEMKLTIIVCASLTNSRALIVVKRDIGWEALTK